LLHLFHQHRYEHVRNYYIGTNYGTIVIDWDNKNVSVQVHDAVSGRIVLTTGSRPFRSSESLTNPTIINNNTNNSETHATTQYLNRIIPCMDNHLLPYAYTCIIGVITILIWFLRRRMVGSNK
jgi:hypothetical protein